MMPASGERKTASRNSTPVTTDAKPVRPPSATPAALSMYVVFEETPPKPPAMAATESTSRTLPMPGTEPSGSARPASAAMPVTVPIVSKKSDSMIAKIVRTAVRNPSLVKAWNGSWTPSPIVEKFGAIVNCDGIEVTPAMSATIVVIAMLMIRAARTFSANSATVIARPSRNTNWPAVVGNASVTSVPSQNPSVAESGAQPETISPPLAKPMNRMNRPMPTPIERLSANGTAFMIASRRPTRTRTVMTTPSMTMTPIAPFASRPLAVSVKATIALIPSPRRARTGSSRRYPLRSS